MIQSQFHVMANTQVKGLCLWRTLVKDMHRKAFPKRQLLTCRQIFGLLDVSRDIRRSGLGVFGTYRWGHRTLLAYLSQQTLRQMKRCFWQIPLGVFACILHRALVFFLFLHLIPVVFAFSGGCGRVITCDPSPASLVIDILYKKVVRNFYYVLLPLH